MTNNTPPDLADEILPSEYWKVSLVDGIYRVGAIVGILPLVIGIYLSFPGGEYFSIMLFVSLYAMCVYFAISQRVHYRLRAALLIVTVFSVGASELYNVSMAADGSLYMFGCVVLVGILYGWRKGALQWR